MNDSVYQDLVDAALHRPLTTEEAARLQAYLSEHPEAGPLWEEDQQLSQALVRLADIPLSANFTSRLVHAVQRFEKRQRQRQRAAWWRRVFSFGRIQQAALATIAAGVGLGILQHYRLQARAELAQSVAAISTLATLPSLDALRDFDSINALLPPPMADADELLAALQ
jgi:anti-sigma factor RsiW